MLSERLGDNGKIVLVPAAAAVAFFILSNSVFTVPTVLSERLGDNGKIVLVPAAAAFVILSNAMLSLNLSSAEISLRFGELDTPAEEEFGGGISNGNVAKGLASIQYYVSMDIFCGIPAGSDPGAPISSVNSMSDENLSCIFSPKEGIPDGRASLPSLSFLAANIVDPKKNTSQS